MQTKPIRALGADITQATLQQTLDGLDIQQQVSQLSYAEKRLLIMVSITQQLSGVTNDWGRTLESPSNQIRIMNEQWQRLQRNVGNIFLQVVGKVLPYLNAVLMVLNEIAKIVAALFGYKIDDFDFFDESAIGGVEDYGDALDGAAESAEKLKHGLRGFDKLNVISSPSSGGGAGGIGGGAGGMNPKLMDAFNKAFDEYNKKLTKVQMQATKIRDRIMEWLGFQKHTNKETGETYFTFKKITSGTVLGALAIGGTIYKGINLILKILQRIGLLKFGSIKELIIAFKNKELFTNVTKLGIKFEKLASTLGISTSLLAGITVAILAVGAALIYAYNHNEKFRESVDTTFKDIKKLFDDLYKALEPSMTDIYELIVPVWQTIEGSIKLSVQSIYDTIVFVFTEISTIIGGAAKIIDDIINGDFNKAFDDFTKMIEDIWKNWDDYYAKMEKRFDDFKANFKTKLEDWWDKLKEKLEEYVDWLNNKLPEWVGELVGTAFRALVEKIKNYDWKNEGWKIALAIWNGINELTSMVGNLPGYIIKKINEKVGIINWGDIGGFIIKGIFTGMWNFDGLIKNWASGFVKGLKKGLGIASPAKLIIDAKIGDYSMDAIMVGMEREMPKLKEEATDIVSTLRNGIKDASIDAQYNYNVPNLNLNSMAFGTQSMSGSNNIGTSVNPTIIVQVASKEVARQVITDLQDMAKDNGSPIMIGG